MRISDWLTAVYSRYVNVSARQSHAFRRRRYQCWQWNSPAAVLETLEPRKMLSAVPMPIGLETRVNAYTTGSSASPSVAKDAAGDYVVSWSSYNEAGSKSYGDIYARRYNASGVAQGSEFLVNTYTTGTQNNPKIAMNAGGDFVITWNSFTEAGSTSKSDVYARRYNAAGIAQSAEFRVNTYTTGDQAAPSVAMDTAGEFVITWNSPSEGGNVYGNFSCYARRYNASGVPQGGEFRVNASTTGSHGSADVAMDSDGDFVITWYTGSVFAKRYNSGGVAQGNEFQVNTDTNKSVSASSVAMDSAGDFVISWANLIYTDPDSDIKAQRYNSAGSAQGSEFLVGTYRPVFSSFGSGPSVPSLAMDATGDFVITWASYSQPDDARSYDATGTAQGSEFLVNTDTTVTQAGPSAALDAAGDFVITWWGRVWMGSHVYDNVYSQRYKVTVADALTVTAPTSSSVTGTSATLGGTVTNDGGSTVMSRGIAFALTSVNSNPQIGGAGVNTVSANGTTGLFTVNVTGLKPGAAYSFVAYARNSVGTSYTPVTKFSTVGALTLSGLSATESYIRGSAPLAIAPNIVVADTAGINIANATVTITNWVTNEDRLNFYNTFALSHSFVVNTMTNTAVLTLTGSATTTAYETTLRSLTFQDVNLNAPVLTARHVSIMVSDGHSSSNTATTVLTVQNVDLAPVLTAIETTPLAYTANASAVPISATLLASDADSNNLTMATVQITSGYQNNTSGHDILSFASQNGIIGSFNPLTGTMTLTGTSGVGNYRTALRSVTFSSLGTGISTATRALTIVATDDYSPTPLKSTPIIRNVAVTDPLTMSGFNGAETFVKGSVPMRISPNLKLVDLTTATISSATVTLTNWVSSEDRLNFYNGHGLQHTFVVNGNANTAVLSLTGIATALSYQMTLQSLTYQDVNFNAPHLTKRGVAISVIDSSSNSATATIKIAVQNVDLAPILSAIEVTPLAYRRNSVPLAISTTLLVNDPDSSNLTKATVQITSGYQNNTGGHDRRRDCDDWRRDRDDRRRQRPSGYQNNTGGHDLLSFVNQNGITGSFNSATGMLTLTGTSAVGNYRLALRSIRFSTSGTAISTAMRTLTIVATDDNPSTPLASAPVTRNITVN